MEKREKMHYVSAGMKAAYKDMEEKLQSSLEVLLEERNRVPASRAKGIDDALVLLRLDLAHCREMQEVGHAQDVANALREMH
jgi:hypothetical protein